MLSSALGAQVECLISDHLNNVCVHKMNTGQPWVYHTLSCCHNSSVLQARIASDLEGSLLMAIDRIGLLLYGLDIFGPLCQG